MPKVACSEEMGARDNGALEGDTLVRSVLRPLLPSACYAGYARSNIVIIKSAFL